MKMAEQYGFQGIYGCCLFMWCDEALPNRCAELINGLLNRLNREEEEKTKIKKMLKVVLAALIITQIFMYFYVLLS